MPETTATAPAPAHPAAENVRWDLSAMYAGVDDPAINADIAAFKTRAQAFNANYKGRLAEKLGAAIADYAELDMLGNKIMVYLFLQQSLDMANEPVKAKMAEAQQAMSQAQGEYLTFFELELIAFDDAVLEKFYGTASSAGGAAAGGDPVVIKHRPWIEHLRVFKPHVLSEPVEAALTKRSPFGPGAWHEFFDEYEADLEFEYEGHLPKMPMKKKTLPEMLDTLSNSKDAAERAAVLKIINDGLGGYFAKYSAQALWVTVGRAAVERNERGYRNPMDARNKENRIPDAVVDALHAAVKETAGPLARRYYRLKARLLMGVIASGDDAHVALAWSDRNAPLPFADTTVTPFDEAMRLVLAAYESFSPTLAGIVRTTAAEKRIDAPATKGKRGGAYNYSIVMPGGRPQSFTFLNYLGSSNDVMTLAHELGHGVHGILAGEAQGPLMQHAPIAYCETASVFGEMTAFNFLKARLKEETEKSRDSAALLAFIVQKLDGMVNTVVRQIGFSNFERRLHGMDEKYAGWHEPKKMSANELDALWLATAQELYGAEGEVFTYENASHLWSYVSHFHRPFYVYGYAFGELLTQSIYAQRERLGESFEPLYLDLLRSGATKNVVELLEPFGLDPTNERFWAEGIRVSLEALLVEAEDLAKSIKT